MTTDPTTSASRATAPPLSEDTADRVLAALQRSAAQARRIAAQTGTRIVVFRDGEVVIEPVSPDDVDETAER